MSSTLFSNTAKSFCQFTSSWKGFCFEIKLLLILKCLRMFQKASIWLTSCSTKYQLEYQRIAFQD